MSQQKIQADYEQLRNLVSQINNVADDWEKWYGKIASQTEILASSWTGRGGETFHEEMEETTLPGLKRLHEGLSYTSEAINKLSAHWQNVDEEITGFLNSSEA